MGILIFLIIVSLVVALFFLGVFIWSVKKGQFDDDYTPSLRMLNDDEKPNVKQTNSINQ
jgi:cbb3-type cytochrome oxidase maturation protein